jgi:hypothetical protein
VLDVQRVVLELDDESRTVLREGVVTGGKGTSIEVLWADGESTSVTLGRRGGRIVMAVPKGSLRHRAFTQPSQLVSTLRSSPATVFAMALNDEALAVPGRRLVELVQQALPDEDASAAWRRAHREFESRSDVKAMGHGAKKRYQRVEAESVEATYRPDVEHIVLPSVPDASDAESVHPEPPGGIRQQDEHPRTADATAAVGEPPPAAPPGASRFEEFDIAALLCDLATQPGP